MTNDAETLTVFMLVRALPAWLALPPAERFAYLEANMRPLLVQHPAVKLRFYDAEFYDARVSDVFVWETRDQAAYRALIEGLRETLFWDHYFQIVDILPAIENAYATHYGMTPL